MQENLDTDTLATHSSRITFFTVATKETANLKRLRESFQKLNLPLFVRGLNDPRVTKTGWGFGYKLIFLKEFLEEKLEEKQILADDLVICLDSADVVMNWVPSKQEISKEDIFESNEKKNQQEHFCQELFDSFRPFSASIVFSAEWFWTSFHNRYSPERKKALQHRFVGLCSGLFAGKVEALLFYLRLLDFNFLTDDQFWWICCYFSQTDERFFNKKETKFPKELMAKLLASETTTQKKVEKNEKKKMKYPTIKLDMENVLFYNMGLDTPSFFWNWFFDEKITRWSVEVPPSPSIGLRFFEHILSLILLRCRRREYKPLHSTSVVKTPYFLHFEGPYFPKKFMQRFDNRLKSS